MALVRGIDVSRYQTITSWRKVRESGIRYVIVKATERNNYVSPPFFDTYRGARSADLVAGSYHFARPAHSSATSQAAYYVSQLRKAGFRSGRDLPPVLDIEDAGGKGKSALTNWCLDFVHEVDRRLGLDDRWERCGVYCNRNFRDNLLDGRKLLSDRWLWLARWPSGQKQPRDDDEMPAGSTIWQWTDKGDVPGISGDVDLNVMRSVHLRTMVPVYYEQQDLPLFRHYAVEKPTAIPAVGADGSPRPRSILFDVERADPAPASHGSGGSSYSRKLRTGWATHELAGIRLEGMKPGDQYQLQIAVLHPSRDTVEWSAVVAEGRATSGAEHVSVTRTMRNRVDQRMRWRVLYFGKETDVEVTRADWIIQEY